MSDPQTYELAPRPGTTTSQRKAELDQARFVAVRNLAYMTYKRPDGHPLMTYQETLDDRERVKQVVIQHELALGLLVNDGQPGAAPVAIAAPMPHAPPNGAPQGVLAAPAPIGVTPMTPVSPAPAPMMSGPPASPQQAVAAAAGAPQEQPQPAAPGTTPTGRRRRSTAPPQAEPGPGVAGPVPSPAAPGVAPSYGAPGPAPYPVGAPMTPAAAPAYPAPVAASATPMPAAVDLTAVIARLDNIGHGLSDVSKDVDELKVQNATLKQLLYESLAALQHVYGQFQPLAKLVVDGKVQTIEDFRRFIKTYTGNPS